MIVYLPKRQWLLYLITLGIYVLSYSVQVASHIKNSLSTKQHKNSSNNSNRKMNQQVTSLVVALMIGLSSGFYPALMPHLMEKKDIQQFGKCSLEETQDIFVDYPNTCYSAFSDLQRVIESNSQDQKAYQQIYTQLCSDECTRQITTFSKVCDAPQYTNPILHACERNTDTGDFCLTTIYTNNGMTAAAACYSVLDVGQCSETCSASLEHLKTDLGCCVNSVFNVTTYGYDKLNIASHELWELCGVSEVQSCDNSPLALTLSGAFKPRVSLITVVIGFIFLSCMI